MEAEKVKLQFQTPQDFQKFRKMADGKILSFNIAELTVICDCRMVDVATAINKYGAIATDVLGGK
ncbi:hypothetical protein [Flaviaesturariibacter amylovorans]|uniref:Uncharacterized protein n=1 Tax=Flaviaesturariibacter amylovorans TaxID=1084520 RepID=A0ABP8GHN3_9BACT